MAGLTIDLKDCDDDDTGSGLTPAVGVEPSSAQPLVTQEYLRVGHWFHIRTRMMHLSGERFLRLVGKTLSSHVDEDAPPLWSVTLTERVLMRGRAHMELVVNLPNARRSYVARSQNEFTRFEKAAKIAISRRIEHFYDVGRSIGEGAFAQVFIAQGKITKQRYAIKAVDKSNPEEQEFILAEVNVIRTVSHQNIVRTYDIFDTPRTLFLVMEHCGGGELFDIIAEAGRFSESNASSVMRSIVRGIDYLALHNIIHRDIKPENVLCVDRKWPLRVKICDFGLAGFYRGEERNNDRALIGTPGYVAPEIVKKEPYGPAVDMWGCGVLLYIMLSGKMPFYGRDDLECLRRIAHGVYSFPMREWRNISPDAVSLVKALLQLDPKKRLTAGACLLHKWLDTESVPDTPIENDLSGIHSSRRKFRKAVRAVMTIERMKDVMDEREEN
eukprot:Plantae.Rhodophyta-Rhodochaete_pulchella.ctg222.p1 GENE.Plantae.Rhodophyta-Rhodochaete_pulchella.ctg222~~Plantae.Rhodophyta-Rhodochaete_pulchella.ctg222.p1  ORF type:complete len:441 (-),score=60.39 Plantae.Rhodophyta-Rhodochaete_pulchella.ctg222:1132-2454(-)